MLSPESSVPARKYIADSSRRAELPRCSSGLAGGREPAGCSKDR